MPNPVLPSKRKRRTGELNVPGRALPRIVGATVRQAELRDLSLLCELVEQYWHFEQINGFDKSRIEDLLESLHANSSLGQIWVALEAESLIGYLLIVHVFSLENGGPTSEIDELFVLPSHRGQGIGVLLLGAAEDVLKSTGCVSIALQLGRSNAAARAFYTKQGYASRNRYDILEKSLTRAWEDRP